MSHPSDPRAAPGGPATFGRLGSAPAEADRGERALWLAGGGYRAAIFHLGALTRLNETGLLGQLGTVAALGGGSIVAAVLATRVPWPLRGPFGEWSEQVARPLRAIARRNVHGRSILRRSMPAGGAGAAAEERYARDLVDSFGGEARWGPRFVFGASGLSLSGLGAGWEDCLEWEIGRCPDGGYPPALVTERIGALRAGLDALGEAEQAVLENHGYLTAAAALRDRDLGADASPPQPPWPEWMDEERVRAALERSWRRSGWRWPRREGRRAG